MNWAILEEKRRVVRMLISEVLVLKGKDREKIIVPKFTFEVTKKFLSLVYNDQSLDYRPPGLDEVLSARLHLSVEPDQHGDD